MTKCKSCCRKARNNCEDEKKNKSLRKACRKWNNCKEEKKNKKVRKGCKNARKNCKEEKKKQLQKNEKCQMNFRTCKKACEALYVPDGRMEFGNTLL